MAGASGHSHQINRLHDCTLSPGMVHSTRGNATHRVLMYGVAIRALAPKKQTARLHAQSWDGSFNTRECNPAREYVWCCPGRSFKGLALGKRNKLPFFEGPRIGTPGRMACFLQRLVCTGLWRSDHRFRASNSRAPPVRIFRWRTKERLASTPPRVRVSTDSL